MLREDTKKKNQRTAGKAIRDARLAKGITQRQLASELGLDYYTFISQLETGQATIPPALYRPMAKTLGLDPTEFTVQCLLWNEPEVFRCLFGSMSKSSVIELLKKI